jgi:hypothetical protein
MVGDFVRADLLIEGKKMQLSVLNLGRQRKTATPS